MPGGESKSVQAVGPRWRASNASASSAERAQMPIIDDWQASPGIRRQAEAKEESRK